jgi:hypothetical protein
LDTLGLGNRVSEFRGKGNPNCDGKDPAKHLLKGNQLRLEYGKAMEKKKT